MDRHCRRAWQGADCHARTCGTWRRTSASLSAGVRPPAASSWCVPNTFPPAAPDAPSPRMGGVSPSASLQNTSYSEPPARKAAGGRLTPARPSPSDSCPVRTRSRDVYKRQLSAMASSITPSRGRTARTSAPSADIRGGAVSYTHLGQSYETILFRCCKNRSE